MSEIQCRKCKAWTNTALANHIYSKDNMADVCYARYVEGQWEKGCGYETADAFSRRFADGIISPPKINLIKIEEGD